MFAYKSVWMYIAWLHVSLLLLHGLLHYEMSGGKINISKARLEWMQKNNNYVSQLLLKAFSKLWGSNFILSLNLGNSQEEDKERGKRKERKRKTEKQKISLEVNKFFL